MVVDLRKYLHVVPIAQRYITKNPDLPYKKLSSDLVIMTFAPCIVINRILAAILGESEEINTEKESLINFYKYSIIIGEEEVKAATCATS